MCGCAFGEGLGGVGVPVWVRGGLEAEVFGAEVAGVEGEGAGRGGAEGEGMGEEGVVGWWCGGCSSG